MNSPFRLAEIALLAGLLASPTAEAAGYAGASIYAFRLEVVDLDLGDGIASAVQFNGFSGSISFNDLVTGETRTWTSSGMESGLGPFFANPVYFGHVAGGSALSMSDWSVSASVSAVEASAARDMIVALGASFTLTPKTMLLMSATPLHVQIIADEGLGGRVQLDIGFTGPDNATIANGTYIQTAYGYAPSDPLHAVFANRSSTSMDAQLWADVQVSLMDGVTGPAIPEPHANILLLAGLMAGGVFVRRRATS